jgi:hypothetical protein
MTDQPSKVGSAPSRHPANVGLEALLLKISRPSSTFKVAKGQSLRFLQRQRKRLIETACASGGSEDQGATSACNGGGSAADPKAMA